MLPLTSINCLIHLQNNLENESKNLDIVTVYQLHERMTKYKNKDTTDSQGSNYSFTLQKLQSEFNYYIAKL